MKPVCLSREALGYQADQEGLRIPLVTEETIQFLSCDVPSFYHAQSQVAGVLVFLLPCVAWLMAESLLCLLGQLWEGGLAREHVWREQAVRGHVQPGACRAAQATRRRRLCLLSRVEHKSLSALPMQRASSLLLFVLQPADCAGVVWRMSEGQHLLPPLFWGWMSE